MPKATAAAFILAVLVVGPVAPSVVAQDEPPPDICLTVSADLDEAGSSALVDAVDDALAARPILIPAPQSLLAVSSSAALPNEVARVAVWTESPRPLTGPVTSDTLQAACGLGRVAGTWSAVISGSFLRAGTKRELAAAPTTPGFSSTIDVEWDEAAELVRTVLTFSGPLDIPNGTCWMDDVVSADGHGGTRAETTTGSRTSPFGDGVCGRFEEYLASGGAGAQALVLLPREVTLPDGTVLRLLVDTVDVRPDGVHLTGTVAEGGS